MNGNPPEIRVQTGEMRDVPLTLNCACMFKKKWLTLK